MNTINSPKRTLLQCGLGLGLGLGLELELELELGLGLGLGLWLWLGFGLLGFQPLLGFEYTVITATEV